MTSSLRCRQPRSQARVASCPTRPNGSTASSSGILHRPHSARHQTCRPAGADADQLQVGHQPHNTVTLRTYSQVQCEVTRKPDGRRLPCRLLMLALRYIHDQPSGKIKTRLDRIDLDILGIVRMAPKPRSPNRSMTGALVLSAAKAASVPPPSATSPITSVLPISP